MKTKLKITLKCLLILAFLVMTSFFTGFRELLSQNKTSVLESILHPVIDLDRISIKEQLALLPDFKQACLLYTSPSPRDRQKSRMPSSA